MSVSYSDNPKLYINELLASNASNNPDPDFFSFCDWIEIYNSEDTVVNISGYYITDDLSINEFSVVNIVNIDKLNLIKSWYLRSRVHNGESGYHLVNLYNIVKTDKYLLINMLTYP